MSNSDFFDYYLLLEKVTNIFAEVGKKPLENDSGIFSIELIAAIEKFFHYPIRSFEEKLGYVQEVKKLQEKIGTLLQALGDEVYDPSIYRVLGITSPHTSSRKIVRLSLDNLLPGT